jgi:hypothetical protein
VMTHNPDCRWLKERERSAREFLFGKQEPEHEPEQESERYKKDHGKPPMSLLPFIALKETSHVLAFGKDKYGAHSWRHNTREWSRMTDALLRHIGDWLEGEDNDPETGRSHLAHAACCVLFLLTYVLTGIGKDDRFKNTPEEKAELWPDQVLREKSTGSQ